MKHFYEADLTFTAKLGLKATQPMNSDLVDNIHRALQRTLEQTAHDNDFLMDIPRITVNLADFPEEWK